MKTCQEIALLVSEGHDRNLSTMERLHIRFHMAMCAVCRRFSKQVDAVRRIAARIGSPESAERFEQNLSPDAKARIAATISRELG
jgi:CII-binding regulator of phage lambda lysogenization HflD